MFLRLDEKETSSIAMIDNLGVKLSYGELVNQINILGPKIERRSVVFVLCSNTVGGLLGYLSFIEYRSVSLLLSVKIDRVLLKSLMDVYTPAYMWIPVEEIKAFDGEVIFEIFGYALIKTGKPLYEIHPNLELLMATSGTTGSPKLVRYKAGNLEANAKNVAVAFGWTKEERAICDLGMQYTMGLNVINTHLFVGARLLLTTYNLMSGDFWDYIKKENATNFTGVPFSYDILARLHFERMKIPNLKTLSVGGGKLTDEMFHKLAMFAKETGRRFIASFGTTETSARMACLPAELAVDKTGSIGYAIPEGELFLVDSNGDVIRRVEAEGELCYKGPNVTMGYALCKDHLMNGDEFCGTYHTGDLARRDIDGCYYITGRKNRFLKLLSYRISLDQCENLIRQKFNVDCACSGTDKKMNIYVVDENIKNKVMDYISQITGLYKSLFQVYVVDEIFRGENGKVNYKKLDANYAYND